MCGCPDCGVLNGKVLLAWENGSVQITFRSESRSTFRVKRTGSMGGFNWSSQHLDLEVCGGASTADGGSGGAAEVEVAGASVSVAGRGAGVLAPDRGRVHQRGCCRGGRRVGAGRVAVVPARWRHATVESERPVGPLPVVR